MSKKTTLEKAQALMAIRLSTQAPGLPLRFHPVIVLAEDEVHYRVTDLGTAVASDLAIVR